jgi:hypothetical protein
MQMLEGKRLAMNRFFVVLSCLVVALQGISAAGSGWPANDQVPNSHTLLEVGDPSTLTGKGFVWSQHIAMSGAIPLQMRWRTTEANPAMASWQVWALTVATGFPSTVVAKGTVKGPGQFVIPANAFLSAQAPKTITGYMIQLTVRDAHGKTIGQPSNYVRVAQYPDVSSPPTDYFFGWEVGEDYSRETGHPVSRFVSYQPPTVNRPGALTVRMVNPGNTATSPVYVEVNDTHGFVGRSERMPTVPALAKGETKIVTIGLEFLRGVPQAEAKVQFRVFTRKMNAGGAIDPWEQPEAEPNGEWLAMHCNGWGCAEQKVNARFEGYQPPTKSATGALTVVFFNDDAKPTLPVTVAAVDVNKLITVEGGVGGVVLDVPGLNTGQFYRVAFALKPTEPNGVPAKPLDIEIVTSAVQQHVFTGLGSRCAGTGCSSGKPFDLESRRHDDNGLLLNPIWHYQLESHLLDPTAVCHHLGDSGSPFPDCSTQMTYWQNVNWGGPAAACGSDWGLGDGHFAFFPVTYTGHIKGHSCGSDGDVCFDFVPNSVALMPDVSFQVFSHSDEKVVVPGVHGSTPVRARQWHLEMNSNATTDRAGSDFWKHYDKIYNDHPFTIDASPATCPKTSAPNSGACQAGATCNPPMFDDDDKTYIGNVCVRPAEQGSVINREAIVTGLADWDCMHNCDEELHPIYVLAIHMKDDPDDDVWAILLNNAGEQGSCGHRVIGARIADSRPYRLRLWPPRALRQKGMVITGVVEAPGTQFMSTQTGKEKRSTVGLNRGDAIIDFSLPAPTPDVMVAFHGEREFKGQGGDYASGLIEGELHLKWTATKERGGAPGHAGRGAVSLVAAPASSSFHEFYIPEALLVEPAKVDSSKASRAGVDDDEEVFSRLIEQAPPEKRAALRASFTKPKASSVPPAKMLTASGPPAATPPVKPEDQPLLVHDTKQIRALCEAFNGNIPHSPASTCSNVK